MKKTVLGIALVLGWASQALAAPVHYGLDSGQELEQYGWRLHSDSSRSSFEGGQWRVETSPTGYEEWMLRAGEADDSKWWRFVSADKGWWVEARLQIISEDSGNCPSGGVGLWIHDGDQLQKLTFKSDSVLISYPEIHQVLMDTTDAMHTYRIQSLGDGHIQVLVDGVEVLDVPQLSGGGGTQALNFGHLGGCDNTENIALWDHFAYDTSAPGTEGDDFDEDGAPSAEDNCPNAHNPEQLDTDGDRRGDPCDPCPLDAPDDSDGDGLCDSEDPCPADPDNLDTDENGICDLDEQELCPPECDEGLDDFLDEPGPPPGPENNGDTDTEDPNEGCSQVASHTPGGSPLPWSVLLLGLLMCRRR